MTKGTAASRAVLAIVGGVVAVSAIGAGIQPLMSIIGLADQSSDLNKLSGLAEDVREKCTAVENGEAEYRTARNIEFNSLTRLQVSEEGDSLRASFDSRDDNWNSQQYNCNINLDVEDGEYITQGEWDLNVTGSNVENPEVIIEAEQQ